MKIFARVFFVYWIGVIVMVALTVVSVATSPSLQPNRLRTIPLDHLRSCAEHELTLYQTGGTSALQGTVKGCEDGLLISRDGIPISGAKLSAEDTRLAMEVADGRDLTVRTLPRETTVALRVGSESSGPLVYLATMPVPGHPFFMALILNNLLRLMIVGGGFCYLLTIFFVRPITALNHAAEQFGAGDLKARVPDRTSLRTDEFGELGRAFNEMATRIESLVARYSVLVLGMVNGPSITASHVIVQPANSGGPVTSSAAGVVPFQRGAPSAAKQVGQIPANYSQGLGTIISGTEANKATEAALANYPGGIVDRVVELSNGEYEVHNIGVNWPHHIFVSDDFKVVGAF